MATGTLGELTARQREVFDWIVGFLRERGYPPSLREMMAHFGSSPNGVRCHLVALRKKGWIDFDPTKARVIRILVGEVCECCKGLGRTLPDDL